MEQLFITHTRLVGYSLNRFKNGTKTSFSYYQTGLSIDKVTTECPMEICIPNCHPSSGFSTLNNRHTTIPI